MLPNDPGVERVHAEAGQRREHFRGVVHLVQLPQHRDAELEIVVEPVAEFVGEEQEQRDDRAETNSRQRRRRRLAEDGDHAVEHAVGEELVGHRRHAEDAGIDEGVEQEIADVGGGGRAPDDAARKQSAHQRAQADAAALAAALQREEGDGDDERAGKRGQRKLRAGGQQHVAEMIEIADDARPDDIRAQPPHTAKAVGL